MSIKQNYYRTKNRAERNFKRIFDKPFGEGWYEFCSCGILKGPIGIKINLRGVKLYIKLPFASFNPLQDNILFELDDHVSSNLENLFFHLLHLHYTTSS